MILVHSAVLVSFGMSVTIQSSWSSREPALQPRTCVCCTLSVGPWSASVSEGREEGGMERGGREFQRSRGDCLSFSKHRRVPLVTCDRAGN